MTEQARRTRVLKMLEEPPPRTRRSCSARRACTPTTSRSPSAPAAGWSRCARPRSRPSPTCWSAATASTRRWPPGRPRRRAATSGRARRLARDEDARLARKAVLDVPLSLVRSAACLDAADDLVGRRRRRPTPRSPALDGAGDRGDQGEPRRRRARAGLGRGDPGQPAQLKELEKRQKSRATRLGRDSLDRALVDLAGLYRDALVLGRGRRAAGADPPRPPRRRRGAGAAGSVPRARCGGSTRSSPAGWRWSRTSSRGSPSRRSPWRCGCRLTRPRACPESGRGAARVVGCPRSPPP